MEPNATGQHPAVGGIAEDELELEQGLDEIEVEEILGHQVDIDDEDDWRASIDS